MIVKIFTDPDKVVKEVIAEEGDFNERMSLNEDITSLIITAYEAGKANSPLEIFKTGESGKLELIHPKSLEKCVEYSDIQEKPL